MKLASILVLWKHGKDILKLQKKLNSGLRDKGIPGTVLFNLTYSPDLWYPYLWMLGGNIIQLKGGHPTNEAYWFPAYNST